MTKKLSYILFFLLLLSSCTSSKYTAFSPSEKGKQEHVQKRKLKNKEVKKILDYAYKFKGAPYKYAGATPKGFDCSGYVYYVFKNFNYILPKGSVNQSKVGRAVKRNHLQPGDLVFFAGQNADSSQIGHVGIVVETYKDNRFKFIHASGRGVVEDWSTAKYWAQRYRKARRILSE
ncbi:MAG: C40 family peptidase [Dysgonamonadaceae bacterium]|jgi:cell wall-associated NlpC family hydrolase|nr:C40 family peptidase [Dysgonamonadaceae bacterium]